MIDKILPSPAAALADVPDGAVVMIGGFGTAGLPSELIDALIDQGATGLTIANNNAGNGDTGLAALLAAGRVRRIICSFPRQVDWWHFDRLYRAGQIELELVPHPRRRDRHRRLLHTHRLRHRTRAGQGNALDRRPLAGLRKPPARRRCADQGATR